MPDTEIEMTIAAELAGTGAPPWLLPLLKEIRGLRSDFAELAKEVRGGGDHPGHAEQLRHLTGRVAFLESLVKWVAGIGTALIITVGGAWATFASGPRPPAGHP